MRSGNLFIALVHFPVLKAGRVVASSITNLDIHDIARVAATYGLGGYFVIHPDKEMRSLAERLVSHWTEGEGRRNADRSRALSYVEIVDSIYGAKERILYKTGKRPLVLGTSAQKKPDIVKFDSLRDWDGPVLLLFGTAGGLADEHIRIDGFLPPIEGTGSYNHLSVRSAVSIFIDRLFFMDIIDHRC